MPSRVYVHLKDVGKPSVIKDGDAVVIDKESGEVTVNDAAGEQLGWFRYANVVGWSVEREPNDLSNLSEKDLRRVIAETQTYGVKPIEGDDSSAEMPSEAEPSND